MMDLNGVDGLTHNIISGKEFDEFSESVKTEAVQSYDKIIRYIQDPSEEAQLAAVKKNGLSINYIQYPSEEVQLAAVNQNFVAIKYIYRKRIPISKKVQLEAFKQDWRVIDYMDKRDPDILEIINQNEKAKRYLDGMYFIDSCAIECNIEYKDKDKDKDGHLIRYPLNPN
jgi:hypothetical protein